MRFAIASLITHGLLVGGMAWFLAHDGAHVEGAPGLAGNTETRLNVTMEPAPALRPPAPAPVKRKSVLPITEGLPVDVKHSHPREFDTPPPDPAPGDASGNSTTAAAGPRGQAGTGSEAAAKIGDSDRSNSLGLYLQKMQRKIQSNLGPAGYLAFPTHAKLLLELRRDGNVTKISVLESSGDASLDRLAIRAVQKSLPFDPWERDQPVELPVVFR